MEKIIAHVEIKFNGIYAYGQGWLDAGKMVAWYNFWKKHRGYWKSILYTEYSNTSVYLVSVLGGAYLHPIGFKITLTDCGVPFDDGSSFTISLSALYDTCKECAEACGATFTMRVSEKKEIDFDLKEYKGDE